MPLGSPRLAEKSYAPRLADGRDGASMSPTAGSAVAQLRREPEAKR
jgi:hypothetical protein